MPSDFSFTRNFMQSERLFDSSTKRKDKINPNQKNPFFKNWKFWAIIVFLTTTIIAGLYYEDVVEDGEDGKPILKPERIGRLADTTRYYEGAEQYVLKARISKYYPCLSCPDRDSIFLFQGEVWKYGITINGQNGRYSGGLPDKNLKYFTEIMGSLPRCKSAEQV